MKPRDAVSDDPIYTAGGPLATSPRPHESAQAWPSANIYRLRHSGSGIPSGRAMVALRSPRSARALLLVVAASVCDLLRPVSTATAPAGTARTLSCHYYATATPLPPSQEAAPTSWTRPPRDTTCTRKPGSARSVEACACVTASTCLCCAPKPSRRRCMQLRARPWPSATTAISPRSSKLGLGLRRQGGRGGAGPDTLLVALPCAGSGWVATRGRAHQVRSRRLQGAAALRPAASQAGACMCTPEPRVSLPLQCARGNWAPPVDRGMYEYEWS